MYSRPAYAGLPPDASRSYLTLRGPAGSLLPGFGVSLNAYGPTLAYLYGGAFEGASGGEPAQHYETGERLNHSRTVTDPTGTAGIWWYDRYVLVIEGEYVNSTIRAEDPGHLKVALRSAAGSWSADLAFSGASGRLRVDERTILPNRGLVQVIGEFAGGADYTSGEGTWALDGPSTFVGLDGATVQGDRVAHLSGAPVALAVAGGITLAAAVGAFFTHVGREFLTFVTGRNVTEPLSSKVRVGMLRLIAENPGITLSQLGASAGMTTWGARYHVGVLKRGSLVDEVRNGAVLTYMLNSHSFRFYADAGQAAPAGPSAAAERPRVLVSEALAELNHPTRRLIFQALRRRGAAHYAELVEAWTGMGVAPPHPSPHDVTYHASKMEEAGLVRRRRVGRHVVWEPNVDLDRVFEHQRRAFLASPKAAAVYRSVASRPQSTLDAILADVAGVLRRRPVRTVREVLLTLEQAGFVERDPERGTYSIAAVGPGPA